ncbi:MAG: flavodoxin domain-containing protein [Anaerolineae bacterium]|nr:flavodoxin domain-containing protein [Anaerolineae bacterium]
MNKQVLVVYGTKYGATAEIAERIGEVLREAGLATDVLPADQAGDAASYDATVLGSAVYIGRWQKPAVNFLKAHEETLAQQPIWLFSSGPTGEGDPVELTEGWRFPEGLQPIADHIGPRDIALFHGALEERNLNFLQRFMIKNVGAPSGDFRDWEAITTWAQSIATALEEDPETAD